MNPTPDELAAIQQAQRDGYYIRSGRTVAALLAWRAQCRANRMPAIIIATGPRQASIEIDGVKRWTGPADEAEQQARALAESRSREESAANLFDLKSNTR